MSDEIFVLNKGKIQQSGTPTDIYDEPINRFVADFIGESNIISGKMIQDFLVEFAGKQFECVDQGFNPNEPVEIVIRPEDLEITTREQRKAESYKSIRSYFEVFIMKFAAMTKQGTNGLFIQRKKLK